MFKFNALGVALLCTLLAASTEAEPLVKKLDKFTAIRTCLPFHLLIKPSEGDHSLTIDAEQAIKDAITAEVEDSVLILTTDKGFNSTQPIRVWVTLPKTALKKIIKSAAADVVVGHGFTVDKLDVLVTGVGRTIMYDITANDLVLESKDIATFMVEGKIKRARVSGAGTSTAYLKGVANSVETYLSGLAKVYIISTSRRLFVTGRARGLAEVVVSRGRCRVRWDFFRRACFVAPVEFPKEDPLYSCGVLADGGLKCSPESVSSRSFLSSGSTSSSAFASSGTSGSSVTTSSFASSFSRRSRIRSRIAIARGHVDTIIRSSATASSSSTGGTSTATAISGSSGTAISSSSVSGSADSISGSATSTATSSEDGATASATTSDDEEAEAIAVISQECEAEDAKALNMLT